MEIRNIPTLTILGNSKYLETQNYENTQNIWKLKILGHH